MTVAAKDSLPQAVGALPAREVNAAPPALEPEPSWKKVLDMAASACLLILLSPVMLAAALLVTFESGRSVIYRQKRVGKGGKIFWLYKFRTMVPGAEKETGAILSNPQDPRVTRTGKWLRKLGIDELPQLFNILRGDMSFVGPRPERPEFVEIFSKTIPRYRERLKARPGLTGLAQVKGTYHSSPQEKLTYDLAYLASQSPSLDVRIILKTLTVLSNGRRV